jgi:hypothetical protein
MMVREGLKHMWGLLLTVINSDIECAFSWFAKHLSHKSALTFPNSFTFSFVCGI